MKNPIRGLALLVLAGVCLAGSDLNGQGVTLFRDRHLRGPSQTFYDDVPDLRYTHFGSRRASSIGVPEGCTAVLYEFPGYRGRSTPFQEDDNDLSNTMVGEDTASSMRVNCRGHYPHWRPHSDERTHDSWGHAEAERRGAVLYRDREGRGPHVFFDRDVPDLDRTSFGSRMASSIDVSPGCILTLYEFTGYRGRHTDFRERDNNLKNTPVGEDRASSLKIRCR